jgi:AcrR family transcriptional regulator
MARAAGSTDRRERLLAAGVAAFSGASYEEVSTERVAEQAGVAQGLLFHYFGSKREFFLEVMRRIMAEQDAGFEANRHRDPARWLRREIELFLSGLIEHPPSRMTAGYAFDAEMRALIDAEQEKTVRRLLQRMGVEVPRPLLYAALRGWVSYALAAGREWLDVPAVRRRQMVELLITVLNASLEEVAALDPELGIDPGFFRARRTPRDRPRRAGPAAVSCD